MVVLLHWQHGKAREFVIGGVMKDQPKATVAGKASYFLSVPFGGQTMISFALVPQGDKYLLNRRSTAIMCR